MTCFDWFNQLPSVFSFYSLSAQHADALSWLWQMCLCVFPSVRLSPWHSVALSKRCRLELQNVHCWLPERLYSFTICKVFSSNLEGIIPNESAIWVRGSYGQFAIFNYAISQKWWEVKDAINHLGSLACHDWATNINDLGWPWTVYSTPLQKWCVFGSSSGKFERSKTANISRGSETDV